MCAPLTASEQGGGAPCLPPSSAPKPPPVGCTPLLTLESVPFPLRRPPLQASPFLKAPFHQTPGFLVLVQLCVCGQRLLPTSLCPECLRSCQSYTGTMARTWCPSLPAASPLTTFTDKSPPFPCSYVSHTECPPTPCLASLLRLENFYSSFKTSASVSPLLTRSHGGTVPGRRGRPGSVLIFFPIGPRSSLSPANNDRPLWVSRFGRCAQSMLLGGTQGLSEGNPAGPPYRGGSRDEAWIWIPVTGALGPKTPRARGWAEWGWRPRRAGSGGGGFGSGLW